MRTWGRLRVVSRRTLLAGGVGVATMLTACEDPPPAPRLPPVDSVVGDITYRTADGFQIVATFTPPGDVLSPWPVVVLLHQFHGTRAQWSGITPDLLAAGFAVLAPDARAHGQSIGRWTASGDLEITTDRAGTLGHWVRDVEAACNWIALRSEIDSERLHVGGVSAGANAAWVATGAQLPVRRAVAVSPRFDTRGLLLGNEIQNFRPSGVLFQTDKSEALQAQALFGRTEEPRHIEVYDASGHGMDLLDDRRARRDFVAWFSDTR